MYVKQLDALLKEWEVELKQLTDAMREDEATWMRIRCNILNIAKAVWLTVCRTEKEEKRSAVYLAKMEGLRNSWQESRIRAEKYEDRDKANIEDIKLDALNHALRIFGACVQ